MSGPGSRKNNLPKQLLLAHAMESAFDDSTKDEGTASSEDHPKENRIGGRGAPCPLKIPKMWALAAFKYFDERFDQTLTGNCDSEELAIMIWLMTNVKPLYSCANLACTTWEQLFAKLETGQQRKKDHITLC